DTGACLRKADTSEGKNPPLRANSLKRIRTCSQNSYSRPSRPSRSLITLHRPPEFSTRACHVLSLERYSRASTLSERSFVTFNPITSKPSRSQGISLRTYPSCRSSLRSEKIRIAFLPEPFSFRNSTACNHPPAISV